MVTVLFDNGAKTFAADKVDQWGSSHYKSLIFMLEGWLLNPLDETYYKYHVKMQASNLINNGYVIGDKFI